MSSFLTKLFQSSEQTKHASIATAKDNRATESALKVHDQQQDFEQQKCVLPQEAIDFLYPLLDDKSEPLDLQSLPQKDRVFVAATIKKVRENKFEIPLLPHAAVCIQQLMSKPGVQAVDFISVIKQDPTLSVELLRMANSSYLGFAYPTLDLQQAIARIGFTQLQGLVTMLTLRSRILNGAFFKNEVEWVMEMSLAMARLCQQLSLELEMKPEEAFTVGLLNHIEYLVILGEASQFSTDNGRFAISRDAITETVIRLGSAIHELIAKSWGFGNAQWTKLATKNDGMQNLEQSDAVELRNRLNILHRSLVSALGGKKHITDTAGFDSRRLASAIDIAVT